MAAKSCINCKFYSVLDRVCHLTLSVKSCYNEGCGSYEPRFKVK